MGAAQLHEELGGQLADVSSGTLLVVRCEAHGRCRIGSS